ncbi:hypothetical protein EQU24_18985 [Methylotuvimicrobium buryatense]|uniref:Uncharacterized protein n=1 Tax=Methylotuvimicrobium buryatense TaxID=95641 RepID=A0A4P9URH2_METBY|nr:hypothetical protein EQU24_18985 [Methylotuvimicrobium buryatense]
MSAPDSAKKTWQILSGLSTGLLHHSTRLLVQPNGIPERNDAGRLLYFRNKRTDIVLNAKPSRSSMLDYIFRTSNFGSARGGAGVSGFACP